MASAPLSRCEYKLAVQEGIDARLTVTQALISWSFALESTAALAVGAAASRARRARKRLEGLRLRPFPRAGLEDDTLPLKLPTKISCNSIENQVITVRKHAECDVFLSRQVFPHIHTLVIQSKLQTSLR